MASASSSAWAKELAGSERTTSVTAAMSRSSASFQSLRRRATWPRVPGVSSMRIQTACDGHRDARLRVPRDRERPVPRGVRSDSISRRWRRPRRSGRPSEARGRPSPSSPAASRWEDGRSRRSPKRRPTDGDVHAERPARRPLIRRPASTEPRGRRRRCAAPSGERPSRTRSARRAPAVPRRVPAPLAARSVSGRGALRRAGAGSVEVTRDRREAEVTVRAPRERGTDPGEDCRRRGLPSRRARATCRMTRCRRA